MGLGLGAAAGVRGGWGIPVEGGVQDQFPGDLQEPAENWGAASGQNIVGPGEEDALGGSRQVHTGGLEEASCVQTAVWGDLAEGTSEWLLLPTGQGQEELE